MSEDPSDFRRQQVLGRRSSEASEWTPSAQPTSVTIGTSRSSANRRVLDYQPQPTRDLPRRFWRAASEAVEETLGFTLIFALFAIFIGFLMDLPSGGDQATVVLPLSVLLIGLLKIAFDIRRRMSGR